MKKIIIILSLVVLLFTGTALAENTKYINLEKIDHINLEFPGSRIRIESWNNDYIKIETTYLVKNDYVIQKNNNIISFDKKEHLKKHPNDLDKSKWAIISNEVFFMITVPKNLDLSIQADYVNIKEGCNLKTIDAKYARVRGSVFMDGFIGDGEKIMIRENIFKENVTLNYNKIIKENYRGFFWSLKNRLFK